MPRPRYPTGVVARQPDAVLRLVDVIADIAHLHAGSTQELLLREQLALLQGRIAGNQMMGRGGHLEGFRLRHLA